jgi:hypothetical protein
MFRSPAVVSCAFIVSVFVFVGCSGGNAENYKIVPLTGKVTMNGSPLADADVQFIPQATTLPGFLGSAGRTNGEGSYVAFSGNREGIPPGKYKVTVKKWVGPDGKAVVPSEGMDIDQLKASGGAQEGVPALYSDPNQTTTEVTIADSGMPPPFNIDIK